MSTQVIDEKVVEMRFDNQQFEKGVKQSMSSIDKLKESLNFSGASKSFNQITEAANNVSFRGLEKNIDGLHDYVSLKAMAMFTVVNNMVSQIQTSVTNMVKQFTIVPLSTGFEEYELKMGSVQTIMAATGESLETVNKYLEELNEYSDKTIYSFSDMTQNIGKFTNAGVKLEDAVLAMKGISNEAAVSGANANEASRAMYNLAQSLSMGYVQYIDWKSIENANMATVDFKNNLADMAVQLGVIKKSSDGYFEVAGKTYNLQQLFKDALKEQWLTTDVLIGTLRDYADETTEIGKKAYAAAQDVKTFTMMMDTLKEAVQSGWAYTWEIVIGDFNQAKEMFTKFANMFGEMIDNAAKARNTMLRAVLGSKWEQLTNQIQEAGISVEAFESRLTQALRDNGIPIDKMIEQWGSLSEAIKHIGNVKDYVIDVIKSFTEPLNETGAVVGDVTNKLEGFQKVVNQVIRGEFGSGAARIKKLTDAGWNYAQVQQLVNKVYERNGKTWKDTTITINDLIDVLGEMSTEQLEQAGITEEEVSALQRLKEEAELTGSNLNELIENLYKPEGRDLIFDSIRNVVEAVRVAFGTIKGAWLEVFPQRTTEELYGIIEALHKFSEFLILDEKTADNLRRTLRGVFSVVGIIKDVITTALRVLFPGILDFTGDIAGGLLGITATVGDAIYAFREFINEGTALEDIVLYLKDAFFAGIDAVKEWIDQFKEIPFVKSIIEGFLGMIEEFVKFAKSLVGDFYDGMAADNANLIDVVSKIGTKIINKLKSLIKLIPKVADLHDIFSSMFEDFKSSGGNVVLGFIEGLVDGISDAIKMMIQFAVDVVTAFREKLGIASPSKVFIWLGTMCVAGLVAGIVASLSSIKKSVTSMGNTLEASSKKAIVTDFIDKMVSYFKEGTTIIIDILEDFGNKLKNVFEKIGNFAAKDSNFSKILDVIEIFLEIFLTFKATKMFDNVGGMFEDIGKGFKNMTDSIGNFFNTMSLLPIAHVLKSLTIAISVLLGVIWIMTKTLNANEIQKAQAILKMVESLIIYLGVIIAIVGSINILGNLVGKNGSTAVAATIASLTFLLIAVGMLLKIIVENIGGIESSDISKAMGILSEFSKSLLFIALLTGLLNFVPQVNLLKTATTIGSLALLLMAIAMSVSAIVDIIYKFFYDKKDGVLVFNSARSAEIMNAFSSLFWILTTMIGAMVLLSITSRNVSGGVAGIALVVIGLAIAARIIVDALDKLNTLMGKMTNTKKILITIFGILISLGGIIALITKLSKNLNSGVMISVSTMFSAFGLSIYLIVKSIENIITAFSTLDSKTIDLRLREIISIMTILTVLIWTTMEIAKKNQIGLGKTILLEMSGFLLAIAGSLWMLTKIVKENDLSKILIAAGMLLSITAILTFILSKSNFSASKTGVTSVLTIIAIAAAVGTLAYSIYMLQNVNIGKIVGITAAFSAFIYVMNLALKMSSGTWEFATVIVALGAAIGIVAYAIYKLSNLPWDDLVTGFVAVIAIVAVVIVSFIALSKLFGSSIFLGNIMKAVIVFLAVAAGIWLIIDAIVNLIEHKDGFAEIFNAAREAVEKVLPLLEQFKDRIAAISSLVDPTGSLNFFVSGGYRPKNKLDSSAIWKIDGKTYAIPNSELYAKNESPLFRLLSGWVKSDKKEEEVITTGSGSANIQYSSPNTVEVKVLKKKSEEVGEEIGKSTVIGYAEALSNPDTNVVETSTESFFEEIFSGFDLGDDASIINNLSDSLKDAFGDEDIFDAFNDLGGDYADETMTGMLDAFKNGDFSNLTDILKDSIDSEEFLQSMNIFGEDWSSSLWSGFNTKTNELSSLSLDKIFGNIQQKTKEIDNSTSWKMTNRLRSDEYIPVVTNGTTSSNIFGNTDLTSLLGNLTASGYNQTISFPDTMTVTNPEAVAAINTLKEDIFNLGQKISNLYVRLDTGVMVGALTPYINQNMGRMAEYKGRGN